jgi:hypothetical protein
MPSIKVQDPVTGEWVKLTGSSLSTAHNHDDRYLPLVSPTVTGSNLTVVNGKIYNERANDLSDTSDYKVMTAGEVRSYIATSLASNASVVELYRGNYVINGDTYENIPDSAYIHNTSFVQYTGACQMSIYAWVTGGQYVVDLYNYTNNSVIITCNVNITNNETPINVGITGNLVNGHRYGIRARRFNGTGEMHIKYARLFVK